MHDEALAAELERRFHVDQHARSRMIEASKLGDETAEFLDARAQLRAVDADNTAWLKGVIDERGWPTISMVGENGSNFAWCFAQHADQDPAFQRRCLDLMTALVDSGEVRQLNVAYLTDRVLCGEGKEQIYGTQMMRGEDGSWIPKPVEDPEELDERRAVVGLEPMGDYAGKMKEVYG